MKNLLTLLLSVLCTLYSVHSSATSYTWTGTTSTAWSTTSNWSPAGNPGAGDNVTIVTATNQPTYNGVAGVTNITMTSGTLNLGGYTLAVSGTAAFNGGTITNGKLNISTAGNITTAGTIFNCKLTGSAANIYLDGSVFNDSTKLTKTGSSGSGGKGGNKFNAFTEISNTGTGALYLSHVTPFNPDTANAPMVFNQSNSGHIIIASDAASVGNTFYEKVILNKKTGSNSGDIVAAWYGKAEFHDTVEVSNVSTRSIYLGYNAGSEFKMLDDATLTIGSAGFTSGNLMVKYWKKLNNTPINITLTGSASSFQASPENVFYGDLTVTAPNVYAVDGDYYGVVNLTKTGGVDNFSSGYNVFHDEFTFTHSGAGNVAWGTQVVPDSFLTKATFINNSTAGIYQAHAYSGHYFGGSLHLVNTSSGSVNISTYGACTIAGNIYVTNTSSGAINFGSATNGTIYLTAGRKIIEGTGGFTSGSLLLRRFYQFGSAATDLNFSSSAAVTIGPYVTLGGDFTYSGGEFYLNGATYNGNVSFTKTGSVNATSSGGNVFNGTATFNSNGTGTLALANTTADDYNGDVNFIKSANYNFYPANVGVNTFAGDVTFSGTYTGIILSNSSGTTVLDGGNEQVFTSRSGDKARKLKVAKSAGSVTVAGTFGVMDSLLFNDGIIKTTGSDMIALDDNCKINTPTDSSYVEGKVKKTGNDAFTFPVGRGGQYRSIAITAPSTATDAYTAEFFTDNSNATYSHSSKDGSIAELSKSEYWKLDRNAGSSNVSVTLSWESATSCGFSNTANLKVAAWDGSTWKDKANGGTTGTTAAGTVVTSAASATYGPYTLATSATFDCGCWSATALSAGNTCLNSQSLSATETWYKFVADSERVDLRLKNLGVSTTYNINILELYSTCESSALLDADTMSASTDTIVTVGSSALVKGGTYYLRLVKSATGTGTADYNICKTNSSPKIFNPTIPAYWEACGLDYMQQSLTLNQRNVPGLTPAGATLPQNFDFTGLPANITILNAFIWFSTVDAFFVPLTPLNYTLTENGNAHNGAATVVESNNSSSTCWGANPTYGNMSRTTTYVQDVTSFINPANYAVNYALSALPAATNHFDITGATMMIIYKAGCDSGSRNARLVIWQGIDTYNGNPDPTGNPDYAWDHTMQMPTGGTAFASNTNERAFFIMEDVETPSGVTYEINDFTVSINPFANSCADNMHQFVQQTTPTLPALNANQSSVRFRFKDNGDCIALSVMGVYTQDNSHECFCEKSIAYEFCDAKASVDLIPTFTNVVNLNLTPINFNGTLHVDADLTFLDCDFIFMGPDAKIIVDAGKHFTVTNSNFVKCGSYMWDGIYATETGAHVTANTGSTFESARNAIVSENGCDVDVSACSFTNCYKGMIIRNYAPSPLAAHPCSVVGATFECTTSLIAPYAGQRTFLGIEVNNAYGVYIGAGASAANTFDNMRYGIKSYNSKLSAYHNTFNNIYYSQSFLTIPPQEGGIYATNGATFLYLPNTGLKVGQAGTNNGNVFNSCNTGVYANKVQALVDSNDFNNTKQGVWVQNLRTASRIDYNTFDNTSTWQGKGIAIQVEGIVGAPGSLGVTQLTIRNNAITDYVQGIWARNITSKFTTPGARPFWIYDNDVYFNTPSDNLNRYGIRLERCSFPIVAKNTVTKSTAISQTGEQSRLRGITIANCFRGWVYENTLTSMGQGIYTTGNDNLTQFYCNQLTSTYNGFFFGPATSITQQGATSWNTDNQWTTNVGAYKMASSSGFLSNINPSVNWYYRASYNPNPVDVPVGLKIITTLNPSITTNHCGATAQPPDAIVDSPDDVIREEYFGPIMRDETVYDEYEEAYKQYDNEMAYLMFNYDDDWFTPAGDDTDDDDYEDWYDAVETGNIGKLLALRNLADTLTKQAAVLMAQPADTAQTLMSTITPTNLVESNELAVWEIYFRTFAIDNPEMTKADTATLLNIAYQVASEGGIGVYMARIMLNIDVDLGESNKTDEEVLLAEPEDKAFALYPNPAKDEVSVFFRGYEEGEQVIIELFELTGRKTISKQLAISGGVVNINTSNLDAGIYLYKIDIASGDEGNGKLVIVK